MSTRSRCLTNILNRRIELWRNSSSDQMNDLGQYPNVVFKVATMWASIVPQTGSLLAGRTNDTALSKTTHKIIVRYRDDILPSDWFMYNGERYNIIYISDPYASHERLEIFCEVLSTK